MKKLLLLFLPVCFLLTITSCNMEKRLYRNGWYIEKNHSKIFSSPGIREDENISLPGKEFFEDTSLAQPGTILAVVEKPVIPETRTAKLKKKIESIRLLKKSLRADPGKRMTYSQARIAMAAKGCTPHRSAMAVYYMSLISVFSIIIGVGFIMCLVTLLISVFAIEKVLADGKCVEENLAIIESGRRICLFAFIGMLIAAVLLFAFFMLYFLSAIGW